ncbi:MAG: hypothetical protein CVU97_00745 [Firmicutes bacterium HGW-Firmicutes-21]|nr:MAG: hypothetical protein CVU97_00745 [Firmicutes bacterium HGW-Firmicutes-21]
MLFTYRKHPKGVRAYKNILHKSYETVLLDITLPEARDKQLAEVHHGDILFIAAPVYSQGAVKLFEDFIKNADLVFETAVAVFTFGGISCGSAVRDIERVLSERGVKLIAAAEIPSRHNFAYAGIKGLVETEICDFRPELTDFIEKVHQKTQKATAIRPRRKMSIHKLFSQELLTNLTAYAPKTDKKLCTGCGSCFSLCPSGAISSDNKICIRCSACVIACKTGARELIFKSILPRLYLKRGIYKISLIRQKTTFFI